MRRCAFTQNEGHDRTAEMNLLPAVHHLDWRVDSLDFIRSVFRVNVLPVLTVGDPVTPALPVSSDPGVKRRQSWHVPSLTCTAESGQWGRIQKLIEPDILRFYECFPPALRIAFQIQTSAHNPKAEAIMLSVLATNGKKHGITFCYDDP